MDCRQQRIAGFIKVLIRKRAFSHRLPTRKKGLCEFFVRFRAKWIADGGGAEFKKRTIHVAERHERLLARNHALATVKYGKCRRDEATNKQRNRGHADGNDEFWQFDGFDSVR